MKPIKGQESDEPLII